MATATQVGTPGTLVGSAESDVYYQRGTGWVLFAGVMLSISGVFKIFDALWAFKYDNVVSKDVQTIVFEHDLSSYGWAWLGVGIILMLAGFAVLAKSQWARWIGIVAASAATITYLP